jgi:hypothetical protein
MLPLSLCFLEKDAEPKQSTTLERGSSHLPAPDVAGLLRHSPLYYSTTKAIRSSIHNARSVVLQQRAIPSYLTLLTRIPPSHRPHRWHRLGQVDCRVASLVPAAQHPAYRCRCHCSACTRSVGICLFETFLSVSQTRRLTPGTPHALISRLLLNPQRYLCPRQGPLPLWVLDPPRSLGRFPLRDRPRRSWRSRLRVRTGPTRPQFHRSPCGPQSDGPCLAQALAPPRIAYRRRRRTFAH